MTDKEKTKSVPEVVKAPKPPERQVKVQESKRVFHEPAADVSPFTPVWPAVASSAVVDIRSRDNLHQPSSS